MPPIASVCQYQDCDQTTQRRSHHLCRSHFYQASDGLIDTCSECREVYKPEQYPICRNCYRSGSQPRQSQNEWPLPAAPSEPSRPSHLMDAIVGVRQIITNDPASIKDNERATEKFCIEPILEGLGWDTKSPSEFFPQQRVSRGRGRRFKRVDFALRINDSPVVFIEVKKHSPEYKDAWDEQLRGYAAHMDSGYAALTNGQIWMIYTVRRGDAQHVSTVDIIQDPESAARDLSRHLSKHKFVQARESPRQTSGWPAPSSQSSAPTPLPDEELRERLRAYRNRISAQNRIPAYAVFSNRAIDGIAAARPRSARQLADVPNVGPRTVQRHGNAILAIINNGGGSQPASPPDEDVDDYEDVDDLPW